MCDISPKLKIFRFKGCNKTEILKTKYYDKLSKKGGADYFAEKKFQHQNISLELEL